MLYPVKIEFKDYPAGSWQDWSEYLSEPPRISKKVESENEGEAGLIVFDDAEVSFRYEAGSPVYSAFSIDLTSKQRYLFRISAPKTDKTFVQLFEGIADFSTLKWNEFENVISFSLVDKLSALNLMQGEITRVLDTLNARVLAQYPDADGLEFKVDNNYPNEIWIEAAFGNSGSYYTSGFSTPIIFPGEIIRDPMSMQGSYPSPITYALVTESWIDAGLRNRIKYIKVDGFDYTQWLNETTYYRYYVWFSGGGIEYGQKEIYGIDILNYNAGVPESINGFSLIDVLIKKAWSDVNIVYRGISSYNIPLSYYILFLDENPLGKTPLDALKMIADSMKCYIFFDRTGSNLIVQSKASLATGGTARSIGNTKIVSGPEKKYFWDKLVDGVTVNVKSWAVDDLTGENLVGVAELTKQATGFSALQKIRPKNSIKRDLLVGDPAVDTQAELDSYAATEALSILNFYGLRHNSFDLTLNLDDNTINWELIDRLTLNSLTTFFTKLEFDLVERTATLESVEITGHDYDFRQLVFGAAESSGSSIISNSGSGGGSYYTGNPIFNLPLQMSGGIVSLGITDNLKLTADKLDAAQAIKTTDTPTFNQMLLSAAATLSNHAVRADRTLQITTTAPLTGGGIAIDLTANRSWTLGINSANLLGTTNQVTVVNGTGVVLGLNNVTLSLPQNIHTGATPTFYQMLLNTAATLSNHAVRADRTLQINTTAPLTGGGIAIDLTANRSWTLGINSANLLGTTNRITVTNGTGVVLGTNNVTLNLPQDIHTGASPTFAGETINGNILQSTNAYIKNDFIPGWTGQGWQLDYGLTYSGDSYLEIDNLRVRGTMNIYELVINQIRATNGSLFVSSVAKVKTVVPSQLYDLDITFEDPDNLGASPFALNDILLIQRVRLDATTVIKKLYLKVENISNGIVGVTYQGAQVGSVEVGDTVARIGNTLNTNRQGTVYLTSDDAASPYIDIYDGVTGYANWATNTVRKVRLGKLTGLKDSDFGNLSGYGLYATNAYLKGGIWATFGNIAGWSIASTYISKSVYNATIDMTNIVNLDASSTNIGLHLTIDNDYNYDVRRLSVGTILNADGTVTNDYGIAFKSIDNGTLFELSTARNVIAGWNIISDRLYSGGLAGSGSAGIELNSSSKFIDIHKDNSNYVKTYYTSTSDWGIKGVNSGSTLFQLGSTNQIAGWTFDASKFYNGSLYLGGTSTDYLSTYSTTQSIVMGQYDSTSQRIVIRGTQTTSYIQTGYNSAGVFFQIIKSGSVLINFTEAVQTIAGWTFDTAKLTKGSATLGISLNTGSTPFITGTSAKGFEVYDYTNPKLFIGQKDGNSLDWNITSANVLTIKGEIKSSRFSTTVGYGGAYSYAVIDSDINGFFMRVQNYTDSNNVTNVRIQPYAPDGSGNVANLMSISTTVSGATQNINVNKYNGYLGISINGSYATRYRGNGTALPTTDLRDGDMYYLTGTGKIYVYAYGAWRVLN